MPRGVHDSGPGGPEISRVGRLGHGVTAPARALRRIASNRPLLRLQLAWAAVIMASWTATVALAVVAYAAGGTPAVALAVLARTVPAAVVGPLLGALVDRSSRQRCLLWSAVVGGVGSVGAAVAGQALVAPVALVAVVALATQVFRTALAAQLPDLVEDAADLTAANVLVTAVEALGVFAGPALAGLLLGAYGEGVAFGAAAALFAASAAVLLIDRPGRRHVVAGHRTAGPRSRGRELLLIPAARLLLALVLVQTVLNGGLVVLYPALAAQSLDADLSAVGLLIAAFGLGGLLGSLGLFALAGSRRLGLLTAVALLLWAVPLLLVPLVPTLTPMLVLLAVVGGGNALFDVACVTLLQRAVPPPLLGRVFGLLETVVVVGLGAGAALAGVAEDRLTPVATVAAMAAVLGVVTLLAARPLHRLDRHLTAPVEQVALLRGLAPFALLPTVELERLALQLLRVDLEVGQVVVQQGEPGSTYFIVEGGELEVTVDGYPVGALHRGSAFGEVALLGDGVRTATVTAGTPAVVRSMEGSVFLAALTAGGGPVMAVAGDIARAHLERAAPSPSRPGD